MNNKINLNQIAAIKTMNSDEIYEEIRQQIIDMSYEPGRMLSENQMVEHYKVSRTVIRAAFSRLQQTGFLEVYPQRGTFVALINLNYVADLLMLRTAIEKEVIFELISYLSDERLNCLIDKLEENMMKQELCSHEIDYHGNFPKLDSEFHEAMIQSVRRESLVALLSPYMGHIARWRNFDVSFDNRIPELIKEHRHILEAVKSKDIFLAQKALAEHLETITSISDRALKEYPTYFIRQ